MLRSSVRRSEPQQQQVDLRSSRLFNADGRDDSRGRTFARFETRFQLCWVLAAFVPVVIKMPTSVGFSFVGALSGFGLVSYILGANYLKNRGIIPRSLMQRLGDEVRRRRAVELGRTAKRRRPGV